VIIFNFSFSISILYRLTNRYCHAFTNASTLVTMRCGSVKVFKGDVIWWLLTGEERLRMKLFIDYE